MLHCLRGEQQLQKSVKVLTIRPREKASQVATGFTFVRGSHTFLNLEKPMIVIRWQAPLKPTKDQALMIFRAEDLQPREETLTQQETYPEHRHPFDEVRMILSGELSMNINGNQLLLRSGDKIIIPSNTKHSQKVLSQEPCECIVANKPF